MVGQDILLSCFPSDVCFWQGSGPSGLGRVIGTSEANLEGEGNHPEGEGVLTSQSADHKNFPAETLCRNPLHILGIGFHAC